MGVRKCKENTLFRYSSTPTLPYIPAFFLAGTIPLLATLSVLMLIHPPKPQAATSAAH